MVNDPVGDLLAQIKNASMVGKKTIVLPYSRMKKEVSSILVREGFLSGLQVTGEKPKESLHIDLRYQGKVPVITGIKRVSKPGLRRYVNVKEIPIVVGGMGASVISTPSGIMTGSDAKKKHIGGEVVCLIW
ncbi:30S ribosomal protein S8 [Candidatus Gottesmanbacteria bacterium]|nr:30S ribosomal protein S8 [Candidatus Gottesmanbacteria bacterium]